MADSKLVQKLGRLRAAASAGGQKLVRLNAPASAAARVRLNAPASAAALRSRLSAPASAAALSRARLGSGLVLFAFVGTHLLNHSLGLLSLEAMEAGRTVFLAVWRNWLGTSLLYGAVAVHLALVLTALYRRRGWRRISRAEVLQIVLGLAVPPLVVSHVIGTRGLHSAFGLNDSYAWVVLTLWLEIPMEGLKQSILVLVAWLHGCMGVHFWLRLKPWYGAAVTWLYPAAVLLPVLAIAGFVAGGREAEILIRDPVWREAFRAGLNFPGEAGAEWAGRLRDIAFGIMSGGPLLLLAAWLLHHAFERRLGMILVTYPQGRRVAIRPGTSVLEASRQGGIPHASVCGGRGRCSTCRVRIAEGQEQLPQPSEEEVRVLSRVGAPDGVRLACQLRPTHGLAVIPLLPPGVQPSAGYRQPAYLQGSEREIAILFADLRSFTRFSERKLPYDVVFVLNQYFRHMGQAIERAGGQIDKFIGDGVMALFGLHSDLEQGCRDGLAAARAMAAALEELNESLKHDLPEPLRMGIGLHAGSVIVGQLGYARAMSVTAIGDTVNTASRLESMTKEFAVQLVISRRVAREAGVDLQRFPRQQIEVRGRSQPMTVYLIESALELPEDVGRSAENAAKASAPAAASPAEA